MLSYEDSLRLKELRYGQELEEGDWYYFKDCPESANLTTEQHVIRGVPFRDSYVKVPTTDGMIEELGSLFWHLENINKTYRADSWPVDKPKVAVTDWSAEQALCELCKKVGLSKKKAEKQ